MKEVLHALLMVLRLMFGLVIHILFIVLALALLVLAIGCLPLDLFVYAMTLGTKQFPIWKACWKAILSLLSWFGDSLD